jgi:hypothetical protein
LIALACIQAWVFRHSVTPDGVAYLDLSDAVVNGRLGDLVNAYWSPLYPLIIGAVRWALAPTPLSAPYWEFAVVHGVNFGSFVVALLAFEALLRALDDGGARWGQRPFSKPVGLGLAYLLFGVTVLSMVSVEGTVPDLLLCATVFAAFACALKLSAIGHSPRTAAMLGVALALGALTKSIMFPVAAIVLATLAAVAWKNGGGRAALVGALVFGVVTAPWVIMLSRASGEITTGKTGALNYAWYVNHQQPANTGAIPALATPRAPLPLDRVAILADARGTNPLWYDPARWNRDIRPRFSLGEQWVRLRQNLLYYVGVLAPILFSLVVIASGTAWSDMRVTLMRGAVILVPSAAAIGAYAMVYATSRYIGPFLAAVLLVLAAAFPGTAPLRAARMALGAGVALLLIDFLSPMRGRVFLTYALAAFVASWLAWRATRGPRFRWALVVVTTAVFLAVASQLPALVVQAIAVGVGMALWMMLSRSGSDADTIASESRLRQTFAVASLVAITLTSALASWHAAQRWRDYAGTRVHPDWDTAQQLLREGITAGSRIAVVGNPERSGWARMNRYHIVAIVPEGLADAYLRLSDADRATMLRAFADAGATRLVMHRTP